jgi:hypothetical protein
MSNPTTLIDLTCNHCGAALQVGNDTRFVTCTYCGSRLEVHHSGGAAYTSLLQSIDQRTEQIAEDVETIKLQNELERLDREWQMAREASLTRNKDGSMSEPSATSSIVGSVIGAAFGILWTIIAVAMSFGASSAGAPAPFQFISCIFPLFGVIFVIAAIAMGIKGVTRGSQFSQRSQEYQAQRDRLLRAIEERRQ